MQHANNIGIFVSRSKFLIEIMLNFLHIVKMVSYFSCLSHSLRFSLLRLKCQIVYSCKVGLAPWSRVDFGLSSIPDPC